MPMEDPLTALLNEHPPQQLSATELRSGLALLEDAARACRAELVSRTTTLDGLPDEIQQDIFGRLCNVLDPRSAVNFGSASKGLREPMQRVGEGARKSPLQQLKEENAAAAALGRKLRLQSCKALREAKSINVLFDNEFSTQDDRRLVWQGNDFSQTDVAMLCKLLPSLSALEGVHLEDPGPADPEDWPSADGGLRLFGRLGVGALPVLTRFTLDCVCLGDAGASRLAAALERGALPRLERLYLVGAAIGDAGLVALAAALRRRPALESLGLAGNAFGDEGLAALVAPPPADAPPPQAEVLPKLENLYVSNTQITDAGCAQLASRLRSGALPALEVLDLDDTLAFRTFS